MNILLVPLPRLMVYLRVFIKLFLISVSYQSESKSFPSSCCLPTKYTELVLLPWFVLCFLLWFTGFCGRASYRVWDLSLSPSVLSPSPLLFTDGVQALSFLPAPSLKS